jgi:PAS domain S-box-containing protein
MFANWLQRLRQSDARTWLGRSLLGSLAILSILALLTGMFYLDAKSSARAAEEELAQRELPHLTEALSQQIAPIVSDLAILMANPDLEPALKGGIDESRRDLMDQIAPLVAYRQVYDQIVLLDTTGAPVMRVVRANGQTYITSAPDPDGVPDPDTCDKIMGLRDGQVYLSPPIVRGANQPAAASHPLLCFGAPLYDNNGQRFGALLLVLRGDIAFFDTIAQELHTTAPRASHTIMLLDSQGYWLVSPDQQDLWGFAYPERQDRTMARQNGPAWARISAEDAGQFYAADGLYSFSTLHVDAIIRALRVAAGGAPADSSAAQTSDQTWKMVIFTPNLVVAQAASETLQRFFILDVLMLLGGVLASFFLGRVGLAREHAKATMQASESKHRTLIDLMPAITYLMETIQGGRTTFVSPQIKEMLGYSPEEWMATPDLAIQCLHPDDRERVLKEFAGLGASTGSFGVEYRMRARDGHTVWFRNEVRTVLDRNGSPLFLQGVMFDITPLKRAETAVRESEELYRSMVLALQEGVVLVDAAGAILTSNPTAERILGLSAEQLRQLKGMDTAWGASHEDGRPFAADEAPVTIALRDAEPVTDVVMGVPRQDGTRVWLKVNARPLKRPGEKRPHAAVCSFSDITHDIEVKEELRRSRDEAQSANRAKSEFLAGMSHEIRTPLNAIIGMTGLLLDTPLNGEQRDYVETVRSSGDSLLAIINDILDFSKIEAGRLDLEQHPFSLSQCVEDALDLLAPRASDKGLDLIYSIADSLPATFVGDTTRVRQILVNLLGNAVKFTQQGEIVVRVTGLRVKEDVYELSFAVQDTGIGIPADKLGRLFQSFSQVDASTTRKYGGTGLGLAISKRLCELMGGRIWVESEPGKGSTFTFTVLAQIVAQAPKDTPLNLASLKDKTILVVDDNATYRHILSAQVGSWGMASRAVAAGPEALALLRAGASFDAAILDMAMPDMDGVALAEEIRRLLPAARMPLLLLSSFGRLRQTESSAQLFAAALTKPVKPSMLYDALIGIFAGQANMQHRRVVTPQLDAAMMAQRPLRILLAEDNVVNQRVALRMLERMGYRADVVANGEEAVAAVAQAPYDVVLMDIQMPEMDGMEATRHIRERETPARRAYIIAMTAHALQGDRERCLAAGMDDYVSKPVQIQELARALLKVSAEAQPAPPEPALLPAAAGDQPPVLDPSALNETLRMVYDDDPTAKAMLIDLFLEDSPNIMAQVESAIAAGDARSLETNAHSLKSSSKMMGAMRVSALCKELEFMGRDKALAGAGDRLRALSAEFEIAKAALLAERPPG